MHGDSICKNSLIISLTSVCVCVCESQPNAMIANEQKINQLFVYKRKEQEDGTKLQEEHME